MKTESASRSSTRESRISSTAGLAVIVSQSRFDNCASPTRCGNQATLTFKSQISLPQIGYAFHTSADCRWKVASFLRIGGSFHGTLFRNSGSRNQNRPIAPHREVEHIGLAD